MSSSFYVCKKISITQVDWSFYRRFTDTWRRCFKVKCNFQHVQSEQSKMVNHLELTDTFILLFTMITHPLTINCSPLFTEMLSNQLSPTTARKCHYLRTLKYPVSLLKRNFMSNWRLLQFHKTRLISIN